MIFATYQAKVELVGYKNMKLKIKKIDDSAIITNYAHNTDSGMDL